MNPKQSITIKDYPDVEARAIALACNVPTGFALLPRNFAHAEKKEELLHEDTAPTVRLLLRENGIQETRIENEGEQIPQLQENAYEWVGPTILVGATVFSSNPHLISVALSVLANYLTEMFRGVIGSKNVRFGLVVPLTKDRQYVRINYDGPVEGIKEVENIIKEVRRGRRR